jgi:UDP-N-acetylglucosamine 1-carboxyvinyltransferase
MQQLKVRQSLNLSGEIKISGAKNAALPIICAGILTADNLHLTNVPHLQDIYTLIKLLQEMGLVIDFQNNTMNISAKNLSNHIASYDLVKTMRASILVLGPLLARFGKAQVSLPGGCAIGSRPVDQHIKGLQQMGADIRIDNGYIYASATKLKGARITMDMVTVTGSENLLMAATLAEGTTILENVAREPEVTDLANCLVAMGAKINGIGTDTLIINGVSKLHSANHKIIADRIESGTYAVATVLTQSNIELTSVQPDTMGAILDKLRLAGAKLKLGNDYIKISMTTPITPVDIITQPYPGFPTDMQAQFMALNCLAKGSSTIEETIFENRYMHVPELCRMGANISTNGPVAVINGVERLTGATVMATDLRASASLVLVGLVADGTTTVDRIYHLDRGYEQMEVKLSGVGANVIRVNT